MTEDLRSLCFQQVDQAIIGAEIQLSKEDVGAFVSGFDRGISIRLDTPRAPKRFGNGLMFALPMLKGEVNIVDLLLIEAVRAFYPPIYEVIRANHAACSGVESNFRRHGYDGSRAVALLNPMIDSLPAEEQEAIKSLLKALFPRLGSAYGGGGYGADWLSAWAKAKRICSPDYCPRYFSYSVPMGDVRDSEMNALYSKASRESAAEIGKEVAAYFAAGKAKRIIERMRQQEKSTLPEALPSLCVAIAANAKLIPNPPSMLSYAEPVSQAGILISQLIGLLPPGKPRVTLSKQVIESADPLWFGSEVLCWLYVTDDADKADSNTLTKEQHEEVGKLLVERIKAHAISGQTLFSIEVPREQSLLFHWQRVDGRDPVQAHLSAVFSSNYENIAIFLQAMAGLSWGLNDGTPHVAELRTNQFENIGRIYDPDSFASLVKAHMAGDFVNPKYYPESDRSIEQRLAEQFIIIYNNWKKGGELPD